jgi:hypothetical protein
MTYSYGCAPCYSTVGAKGVSVNYFSPRVFDTCNECDMVKNNPRGTATKILAVTSVKSSKLKAGIRGALDEFDVNYSTANNNCATFITKVYKGAGGAWSEAELKFLWEMKLINYPELAKDSDGTLKKAVMATLV